MAIEATQAVTTPIAPTEVKKAEEAKPKEAASTPQAPASGDSVAQATPTDAQGKKVDVTV